MLFATLDQVVWLTSSEGLNPRVNRTKGALTKRILCPKWLSPCHQAMPHALSYTHGETGLVQLTGCSTCTCTACILHCTTHVFSSAFTVPGKPFFQSHTPPDLFPREKCPAFKANWLMSPVEHIWYLYQQNWAVSLICEGRVRGTREVQTFLGGTCCLRLTDCHINKAQNLSFSGWHPEIWDTH